MNIDTGKTPIENVIALINHDNSTTMTAEGISLGSPAMYTDPEGVNTRNTEVVVSGNTGNGYTDSVTVRYTRLELAALKGALTLTYTLSDTSTLETMISSIATQMDIVNDGLEVFADDGTGFQKVDDLSAVTVTAPRVFELRAVADSYLYVGAAEFTVEPNPSV